MAAAGVAGYFAAAGTLAYAAIYAVTYIVATFVIGYGLSMLASALGPDPNSGTTSTDEYEDPVYLWGDLRQTEGQGNNVPIIFGETLITGQTINKFTSLSDGKETLSTLIGICDHELDSITDVQIAGNPNSYYNGVEIFTRLGSINDTLIPGFDETVTQTDINAALTYGSPITQQTQGSGIEKIVVRVTAPNGIYYSNDEAGLDERTATYMVEYKLSSSSTWIQGPSTSMTAATTEAQRSEVSIDDLAIGQYDVRVSRTNAEGTSHRERSSIRFTCIQEMVKDGFIYPGLAKYAVKVLATDQLSGAAPVFSCTAKRSTVQVWDESLTTPIWVAKSATNPAWIVYSLLTEFAGLDKSKLIWDDFKEWADYCDESVDGKPRCSISIILSSGNYWSEINKIAKMGRAAICRRGTRYGVFVDKVESIVSAMFNTGNIIAGSFSLQYLPKADRANAVDVEYTDPDREYTRQVVSIYSDDYLENGSTYAARSTVSMQASLTQAMAVREGVYRINSNRYLSRTVTFEAFTDSFACTVGDLFYFQHQYPDYGKGTSGRVIDAGNDGGLNGGEPFITIDQDFDTSSGGPYKVRVRLGDGTFVEKTVLSTFYAVYSEKWVDYTVNWGDRYTEVWSPGETVTIIILDSVWTTVPEKFDVYALGNVTIIDKTYRLTTVDRKDDFTRTLTGIEYVEDIYSHNDGYIIEEPDWVTRKPKAINVSLSEFLTYAADGGYQSNLNIAWDRAYTRDGNNWTLWIEDVTGKTKPTKVADVFEDSYTYFGGLVVGHTYKFYVAAYGEGPTDTGANTATYAILGKLAPPADITNFVGTWDSITRQINFVWSALSEIDIDYYEIRYGTAWATAVEVITTRDPYASLYNKEKFDGSKTYLIKARDKSRIYSENASSTVVSIDTSETPLSVPGGLALTTTSDITTDGTNVVSLVATWNNTSESSDFWSHYDLILEEMTPGNTSMVSTSERTYRWEVIPNTLYGVTIRAVDTARNWTAWTTQVTINSSKDTTAPSAPTSVTAGGTWTNILITWSHGSEYDLSHFEVYRNTTNSSSTASVIGSSVRTFQSTFGSYVDAPSTSDTYYYWVKAVDRSGNASAFSSVTSGSAKGVDVEAGSITTVELADGAVTEVKISDLAVSTGKLAALAVEADKLAANAVTETKISDLAVSTGKLAELAVAADKIAANAVTEVKISDLAVSTGKLAALAVEAEKLATGAVTETKISDLAVSTGKLAALAVDAGKLASNAVTETKILDNAISTGKIQASAITANEIAANAIISDKILADAIISDKIAANAITTVKIAASAITADEIAANAVISEKILADAIVSDKIAANAITTAKITANAITADEIAADAVVSDKILAGAIVSDKIAANAITTAKIAANAVTANEIVADAITTAKIAANAITADEIAANAIISDKILTDAIVSDKIQANAITTVKIEAGAVTANEIKANTVTASQIAANTITSAEILAGTIGTDELAANSVVASKINVTSLDAIAVNAGTITAGILRNAAGTTYLNLTSSTFSLGGKLTFNGTTLSFANGVINASALNVTSLSAINANLGTVTAGVAKSSDGRFYMDLDNKRLRVFDASNTLRVELGYIA
ncbi:MAG: hypothetical protein GY799_21455 [Desulfobulbaceae bacterium]|nr:hypothetical protein [Desulfobulbaceae bacterium]